MRTLYRQIISKARAEVAVAYSPPKEIVTNAFSIFRILPILSLSNGQPENQ